MPKLRTIQIGLGHDHATSMLNSALSLGCYEVCALAIPESEQDRFGKRADEYRERGLRVCSVNEALAIPGIQAAIVETEEVILTKYALLAAEHGLHVIMDKPGGCELAEFERLVETLRSKNLAFSVGYMYRFNPKIREVIAKIERGELGEIYCVEAHMDCEHGSGKRKWLDRFKGGMMFFLGCHLVDLIYRIMGEPEEVIPLNHSTHLDGIDSEDCGFALLRYKNGISFAKSCAAEIGGFRRRQLVICGSKGTVELKPLEILSDVRDRLYTEMRETHPGEGWNSPGVQTASELFNRFDDMMETFARTALGELENPFGYDYELAVYRLVLRCCGVEI